MRPKTGRKEDAKIRIIAVYRILQRGRRVTASQILRELESHFGIVCDRKTLYTDVAAVDRFTPIDIKTGRGGGYCICDVLGRCESGDSQN